MEVLERPAATAVEPGAVARVLYASESLVQGPIYSEMERIRASALRHNLPLGIYTALMWRGGWFIQWKEGPADAMRALMERVARDPRHRQLHVVHSSVGKRLLHGPWSMAIIQSDEPAAAMSERLAKARAAIEQDRQHNPQDAWRRLVSPMPYRSECADAEDYQRVLVCSAMSIDSFDLVRWLGTQHREPVVHRRYAGTDLDVGADFVDFVCCGRPMRVTALGRNGLTLPITRAMLSDYSHIVLLLSGSPGHDDALVRRVGQACAPLDFVPPLVGVGADASQHRELFTQAHRMGMVWLDAMADARNFAAAWTAMSPLFHTWRRAPHGGRAVGLPRLMRQQLL